MFLASTVGLNQWQIKKTETVGKASDEIFKSKRKAQMLWVDKGSEFMSKHLKDFI